MKNNTKNKKIHIMYGLPGSGKTYFCSQYCTANTSVYLDLDHELRNKQQHYKESLKKLLTEFLSCGFEDFFVDGLFTTKESLTTILEILARISENRDIPLEIVIHAWNEDRETCLKNDFKRRNLSSASSIKNMPFDEITFPYSEFINQLATPETRAVFENICVSKHVVLLKPSYKIFYDEMGLPLSEENEHIIGNRRKFHSGRYICSSEWSLGGTAGYYTGDSNVIQPEQPLPFTEFENIISMIDENIPYNIYKKIYDECVEIVETTKDDYYSGIEKFNHYELDLQKMYDVLEECYFRKEEKESSNHNIDDWKKENLLKENSIIQFRNRKLGTIIFDNKKKEKVILAWNDLTHQFDEEISLKGYSDELIYTEDENWDVINQSRYDSILTIMQLLSSRDEILWDWSRK